MGHIWSFLRLVSVNITITNIFGGNYGQYSIIMGECIGGIAHDAASSLTTHKPSKSFGDLFEEKKAQLESLQAGLARAVLPKPLLKQKHTSVKTLFVLFTFVLRRSFLTYTSMLRCKCVGGLGIAHSISCWRFRREYLTNTKFLLLIAIRIILLWMSY